MGSDPLGIVSDSFLSDVLAVNTIILINMFPQEAIILAYLCDSCEEFMSDQIGRTLSWIGIEETDVVTVQMQDQKLIQDDTFYKNLMVQVALEHEVTQLGIIELLSIKSQGIRSSMQKFSRYGKNTYVDGLPEATINTIAVNHEALQTAIVADRSHYSDSITAEIKVPKEHEWVSYRMTQLYGYIASTEVFYYSGAYYNMTGFYYDYTAGDYVVQAYLVSTPTTIISIHIGNYTPAVGYVVHYTKTGTLEEYYWIYFIGTGNTTLDNARSHLSNLDMLPIVELRRGGVSIDSDVISDRYKQTVEILGYLGIDVTTMLEGIHSNPNIADVRATYIYFGAEIGSNNPMQAKLVYNTLEYLWIDPAIVSDGQHRIQVKEGDYNSSISWDKQERLVVARSGVVIGTYEGGVGEETLSELQYATYLGYVQDEFGTAISSMYDANNVPYYYYADGTPFTGVLYNDVYTPLGNIVNGYGDSWYEAKKRYYGWARKQETSDEYVEYRIYNVSATTVIMKGAMGDMAFKILSPTELIVMPISYHFLSKFSPIDQGKLFPEILRMVTYSLDVQHLRYYETPEFMQLVQIVVVIIAIVLFILSLPAGGAGAYAWLAFVGGLLLSVGVAYALKQLLLQIDNPALRAVVAAIVVVAMAYAGNTKGASDTIILVADMVTTAVSSYSEAIMEGIAEQFAELAQESALFTTLLETRQKEIDEKNDKLQGLVSTEDVMKLSNKDNVNGYIEGVDLKYYRAIQMQYDWELSKSMKTLTGIYNYDALYKVGVQ